MFLKIISTISILVFISVGGLLLVSSFDVPGVNLDARVVQTGSMEPAIGTGSVVFIRPEAVYTVGDIITFDRRESGLEIPVTHRVIETRITEGQMVYLTKGDANESQDLNPVYKDEVLGKVLFHIPLIGYLLDIARTPWGFILFIVFPALLVIMDEIKNITREVCRKKEATAEELPSSSV